MARLYRTVKLFDLAGTQVFTFRLPPSLVRDFTGDVMTQEFAYGHQRWTAALRLSSADPRHVGAAIALRGPVADGTTVTVDVVVTLLNGEHFSRNLVGFTGRRCRFTSAPGGDVHGQRTFAGVQDLCSAARGYVSDNGEYLLEVEMANAVTTFEQVYTSSRTDRRNVAAQCNLTYSVM